MRRRSSQPAQRHQRDDEQVDLDTEDPLQIITGLDHMHVVPSMQQRRRLQHQRQHQQYRPDHDDDATVAAFVTACTISAADRVHSSSSAENRQRALEERFHTVYQDAADTTTRGGEEEEDDTGSVNRDYVIMRQFGRDVTTGEISNVGSPIVLVPPSSPYLRGTPWEPLPVGNVDVPSNCEGWVQHPDPQSFLREHVSDDDLAIAPNAETFDSVFGSFSSSSSSSSRPVTATVDAPPPSQEQEEQGTAAIRERETDTGTPPAAALDTANETLRELIESVGNDTPEMQYECLQTVYETIRAMYGDDVARSIPHPDTFLSD